MHSAIERLSDETIIPIAQAAGEHIQRAHEIVVHRAQWLGRQIHDLTHSNLPRPIAIIAEAAIRGLPFALVRVCCPIPVLLATIGITIVYTLITTPRNTPVSANDMSNGFGFGTLWCSGASALRGIATGNDTDIAMGAVHLISALFIFVQSGLVAQVCTAPRE